jgi:hypothetical protein
VGMLVTKVTWTFRRVFTANALHCQGARTPVSLTLPYPVASMSGRPPA